jgi:hypothetical protein
MANKKVSQLTSKPSVLVTDLFPIADPSTGQLYKTTISDLGTAIGSGVSSVNGLVGAVVLDTDDIQELASPTNKWFTDTRARAAISAGTGISYNSGTGVITNAVTSGQIITALGYTPANPADVVPYTGATGNVDLGSNFLLTAQVKASSSAGLSLNSNNGTQVANLGAGGGANITFYGGLTGTTATFTNSGSGIGLGVTLSGSTGDGIKITHSAGRAFNIQSSGSGYGVLINNETASTSAPFTIQKQGSAVVTFTDAGVLTLSGALNATAGNFSGDVTLTGGNPRLYLTDSDNNPDYFISNTDGTFTVYDVTNSTSRLTLSNLYTTLNNTLKVEGDILLKQDSTVGPVAGYTNIASDAGGVYMRLGTASAHAYLYLGDLTTYQNFTFPNATGTIALTSNLASYLPLSGGTLTGALTGTSATFSGDVIASNGSGSVSMAINRGAAGNSNGLRFRTAGTNNWYIGSGATGANTDLEIYNHNTATTNLSFAYSSGAATFSSSVTANTGAYGAVGGFVVNYSGASTSSRSWRMITEQAVFGDFSIQQSTTQTGSTYTDRLYINPTGSVGMGTTSPYSSSVLTLQQSSSLSSALTLINRNNTQKWALVVDVQSVDDKYFGFYDITNPAMRMVIGTNGNVGIGTATPYSKLDVAGSISINGRPVFDNSSAELYIGGITGVSGRGTDVIDFYTANSPRMRITSGGYIGINTTSPGILPLAVQSNSSAIAIGIIGRSDGYGEFHFRNNANSASYAYIQGQPGNSLAVVAGSSGGVYLANGGTSWTAISDERMKTDLMPIENATKKVGQLRSMTGRYRTDSQAKKRSFLIAQDVLEVLPEAVNLDTNSGMYGVQYTDVIPLLVASIKELKAELDTLKNK